MHNPTIVLVDPDLLPQITGELLALADDPSQVEVVHGDNGRHIVADGDLADRWFSTVNEIDLPPEKKKVGRPRKTSASLSED